MTSGKKYGTQKTHPTGTCLSRIPQNTHQQVNGRMKGKTGGGEGVFVESKPQELGWAPLLCSEHGKGSRFARLAPGKVAYFVGSQGSQKKVSSC